jgi:hypothetical protein
VAYVEDKLLDTVVLKLESLLESSGERLLKHRLLGLTPVSGEQGLGPAPSHLHL